GSSNENGGAWSMMEDLDCPVTGNEIKFSHMWKKIHQAFCERAIGSTRTEMTLSSRWKVLNKELGKWRNALAKAIETIEAEKILAVRLYKHKNVWCYWPREKKFQPYPLLGGGEETCKRFQIIPTGPTVVLNETPLHETPASDSPMDSPMITDSPIENNPRPIGRKAAKAKKGIMRIEMDLKQQERDMAVQVECAKEREYVRKEREYVREQNIEKKDRETMAMDTSHMSPETKQFWKLERRDVMRRRLFCDDGPSNTDCQ
ncbi:zinc ion-binding protein, partial [Prunus dulcis]